MLADATPSHIKLESGFGQFLRRNWLFLGGTFVLLIYNISVWATSNQGDTLLAINKLRTPFWDVFYKVGTHFAEVVAYAAIIIIVAAFSYRRAIFVVVTGAFAGITAGLLKMLFAQARPHRWLFDNFQEVWQAMNHFEENWRSWDVASSFPSGHATSAFALYSFLAFNSRWRKNQVQLLCLMLAVMVGFSRMYLIYHFLRDVTVGAALGTLIGGLVYYLQSFTFRYRGLDGGYWR